MKLLILALLVAGATSLEIDARIVGGSSASISNYPWQGALLYDNGFTCGAVLISSNQVLTAAHCVDGRENPPRFSIRFGSNNHGSGGSVYNVASITKHSGYTASGGYPNDIASMSLTSNAGGSNISPINRLDNRGSSHLHSNCKITGWGRTCGTCSTSSSLRQADTTCISRAQCSTHWNNIGDYHQCLLNGSTGACSGDSGGPLSCQDGGNTLVGITSWGSASCSVSMPSVYVRVSYYCSWINSNTGVSCG